MELQDSFTASDQPRVVQLGLHPGSRMHSLETSLAEISRHQGSFYDLEVVASCLEEFTPRGLECHLVRYWPG